MKLLANVTKRRGDKVYKSYRVTLPRAKVEELDWEEGDELEATIEGDTLVLTGSGSK